MSISPGLSDAGPSRPTTTKPSQGDPVATGGGRLALAGGVDCAHGAGVLVTLRDSGRCLEEDTITPPRGNIAYARDFAYFRALVHRGDLAGVVSWSRKRMHRHPPRHSGAS